MDKKYNLWLLIIAVIYLHKYANGANPVIDVHQSREDSNPLSPRVASTDTITAEKSESSIVQYPIHAPVNPYSSSLYDKLAEIFASEGHVKQHCKKIPITSGINSIMHMFFSIKKEHMGEELSNMLTEIFHYLNQFCDGYQETIKKFQGEIKSLYGRSSHEAKTIIAMANAMDGKKNFTAKDEKILQSAIRHIKIKEWIRKTASENGKITGIPKLIDYEEGIKAALEEISDPSIYKVNETNEYIWHDKLFSIRLHNKKLAWELISKPIFSNNEESVTKKVVVGKQIKSRWLCCFSLCVIEKD